MTKPEQDLKLALAEYEMTPGEMVEFINGTPRFASIASLRKTGAPIVDGIGLEWDTDSVYFSVRNTRALMKRLARDRRVCVHIMNTEYPVMWVRLEGEAVEVDDPDFERTFRIMHRYMAMTSPAQALEDVDMAEFERAYTAFGRTMHRVKPTRIHSHDARKQATRFDLGSGRLLSTPD